MPAPRNGPAAIAIRFMNDNFCRTRTGVKRTMIVLQVPDPHMICLY